MAEDVQSFVIIGVDINSYSLKPIKDQNAAQRKVDDFFADAISEYGGGKQQPHWLDTGDGGYLLLEWSPVDALLLLERFFRRLDASNDEVKEERRVDVRAAIHHGQVIVWKGKLGSKFTSDAINGCCRLLGAIPRENAGQVVCSEDFQKQINVLTDHAEVVRLRDVKDKHGKLHSVFNLRRKPGFGIDPPESEMHENPQARFPAAGQSK